jgi:hypothetical protein
VGYDKSTGTTAQNMKDTMTTKEFEALVEYLNTEGNLGDYWLAGGLEDHK